MKRSLAEMTPNCYGLSRNMIKNCSEMTVFERQQTQMKFLQQQQHHQSCTSDTQCSMTYDQAQKIQASLQTQSLTRGDIGLQNPMMMLDHWFGWPEFGHISMQKEMFHSSSDCENKYSLETSSLTTAPEKEGDHSVATPMSNLEIVNLSLKKRKMDQFPQPKFVTDGVTIDKRIKRCTLDEDSSITPHSTPTTGRTNISKEVSAAEVSMRSSRMSEITKPDYIQVRARRGQATDSHSLAERARREKISQKMRFLQDLVPGCNKITGKMGMLDEIINYVRALQCQVEFLSMKLASVTTTMDFNNGKVLPTEVLVENSPRYHRVTILDASSHANFPLNQRRAPALVHDNFLEASGFTPPPTWDADFQAVQGLEFHQ